MGRFGVFTIFLLMGSTNAENFCRDHYSAGVLSFVGVKSTKRTEASFLEACGHVYYFSNLKVTSVITKAECKMRKMETLTLEVRKERACFAKMAKTRFENDEFWVSALRLPSGYSSWCLQDTEEPFDVYAANQQYTALDSLSAESLCVYVSNLTGETVVLKEEDCFDLTKRTFVCKVKDVNFPDIVALTDYSHLPQCAPEPAKLTLVHESVAKMQAANSKFLQLTDGSIFHLACNKTFFITAEAYSWREAMKQCCKFGLAPLKLESEEEFQCLYKAMSDVGDFSVFWTSGHNPTKEDQFQWIDFSKVGNFSWALNQPDKPQESRCVSVAFREVDKVLSGLQNSKCFAPMPVFFV